MQQGENPVSSSFLKKSYVPFFSKEWQLYAFLCGNVHQSYRGKVYTCPEVLVITGITQQSDVSLAE